MIRFVCSHCGKAMRTPASAAGKNGRCPFCKTIQAIPQVAESAFSASALAANVASPAKEAAAINPPRAAVPTPAKKMYREYTGADAGKRRSVSVNFDKKK